MRAIWVLAFCCSTFLRAGDAAPAFKMPTPTPSPNLKTGKDGMQYYLSLPKDWSAEKRWPVMVTIVGSGRDWEPNFRQFVSARGERPYVVVTPVIKTLGKSEEEFQQLAKLIPEVLEEVKGEPRVFMTGFSAGGHTVWQFIFRKPEMLAAAAPACSNFGYRLLEGLEKPKTPPTVRVHAVQGEKDSARKFLDPQFEQAAALGKEHGYPEFTRELVPGMEHNPCPKQAVEFFEKVRTGK